MQYGYAINPLYQYKKVVLKKAMKNDENMGSSFYAFVQEEPILEDETEVAIKRIVDCLGIEALRDHGSDG